MKTFEKTKERQEYLFSEMASLLGALASPVRLKIIHFLFQAPHSVEQLSLKIGQSVANTSMHLKKMQRENILKTEVLGQKRVYSLAQLEMREFWEQIQTFAKIHNSTNVIFSPVIYHEELAWPRDFVETIKMIQSKKLVLLDVRPADEVDESDPIYKEYVIHIPAENLKKETHLIPTKKPVLVICRGRLCVMSNESTFLLRKLGFEVYKFDHSWYQISKIISKGK
jgi:DNA-binding transcriptional ArsR family regulator/rhodanese-related sulfurtransferase